MTLNDYITPDVVNSIAVNVLANATGEKSLYDKLEPFLTDALGFIHFWLLRQDLELQLVDGQSLVVPLAHVAVYDALYNAIPALDLVLTPNGYAIVSNSNLVPASKERVASLRDSTLQSRDRAIDLFLRHAFNLERGLAVVDTPAIVSRFEFFRGMFIPTLELSTVQRADSTEQKPLSWKGLHAVRDAAMKAVEMIIDRFLPREIVRDAFGAWTRQRLPHWTDGSHQVTADAIAQAVRLSVAGDEKHAQKAMMRLLDYYKSHRHALLAQRWLGSDHAKFFITDKGSPLNFENKPNDKGFFF